LCFSKTLRSNVLAAAGSRSLVLVDELGKGTEVRAGTALAGALLEALVARRVLGVFASHLHLLHRLPLRAAGLEHWRMEVADEDWAGPGPYLLAGARCA
jgi:DNA mismatch repair ATPase MutS